MNTPQQYPSTLLIRDKNRIDEQQVSLDHKRRIRRELKRADLSRPGLLSTESRYLPRVVHPDEHIGGVLYGRNQDGFAMLVATDRRIIFLDKKPLFFHEDDITFYVVSGITYTHAGFGITVTLHTRLKDYMFRTFNKKSAERFVKYIELRCLEHKQEKEDYNDHSTKSWAL